MNLAAGHRAAAVNLAAGGRAAALNLTAGGRAGALSLQALRRIVFKPGFVVLFGALLLSGCTEHATEADKATAARSAAARQQQVDEAAAAQRGIQAAEGQLAQLPPPAKGRYLQVHSVGTWANPFLIVGRKTITLHLLLAQGEKPATTLPNKVLPQTGLKPLGADRYELTLRITDLPEALASLPGQSWPYGRVVAVEEDPATPRRERPQMRRNVEAVMAMLNDLDVVANEWPYGQR